MNKGNYVCGICGTNHEYLEDYLDCVNHCGKKVREEMRAKAEKERMEKVNAALNGVKQAKAYYEEQLAKFKNEFPDEYKMNFGDNACTCGGKCDHADKKDHKKKNIAEATPKNPNNNVDSIALSYKDNGKDEPEITAKVNGKTVENKELEKLFNDPDVKYLAEILGIM